MITNDKYTLEPCDNQPLGPEISFFRLRANRDIGDDVKAGDLGGLVGGPASLSPEGECWVYPNALVRHGAVISENAKILDKVRVLGPARISGDSVLRDTVQVLGDIDMEGGVLRGCTQVVSAKIMKVAQYQRNGTTFFVFGCTFDSRNTNIHFSIDIDSCSPRMAGEIALLSPGDMLRYVTSGDVHAKNNNGPYPIACHSAYGRIKFNEVKEALMRGKAYAYASPNLENVTRLTSM